MRSAPLWTALAAAVLGLAVTAALLALLLWPPLDSALRAETADGSRTFVVPAAASTRVAPGAPEAAPVTVIPGDGWAVQPAGDELLLHSPDRMLAVTLGVRSPADAEAELTEVAGPDAVLFEVLASGLELRHFTRGETLVGVVATPGVVGTADGETTEAEMVQFEAQTAAPAQLADYRPALAELIASIEIAGES